VYFTGGESITVHCAIGYRRWDGIHPSIWWHLVVWLI